MNFPARLVLLCALPLACGGGGGGGDGKDDRRDDLPADAGAGDYPDDLSPSPVLEIPGIASAMADNILSAPGFDAAYEATLDALAEGGIATQYNGAVTRAGKAPATTLHVWPRAAIDLTLEATQRRTMYSLSLADFALMLADYGFPYPAGMTPSEFWVTFLADWYVAAESDVEAVDSFAVFFLAAMNQKQEPRANIATGTENPELIRLSLLEMELLIAAFERVMVTAPGLSTTQSFLRAQSAAPCSDMLGQLGIVGSGIGIATSEVTGKGIDVAATVKWGEDAASNLGNALSALGIAAKLSKLVQQFRYGYITLDLDTPAVVKKPLKGQANKSGHLTATAGVNEETLQKAEEKAGGPGMSGATQAVADCLGALGLPTATDARDIANDAANWRTSYSIVAGGGSQVLWARGEPWDIDSRSEKYMRRDTDATAVSEANFDILPQASQATVGKERTRKAVFKVQLRRGSAPDIATAWGAGKAGFAAGNLNPIAAILGLSDALIDILGKWILETASPTAQVTQTLTEIQPTGLVGTITWTIEGHRFDHDPGEKDDYVDQTARVVQRGHLEIVSQSGDQVTAFGGESCTHQYLAKTNWEDVPEGAEVVGSRFDQTATLISDSWESNPDEDDVGRAASYTDWNELLQGAPPGVLEPEVEALRGHIWITPDGSARCGPRPTKKGYFVVDHNYIGTEWVTDEDYTASDDLLLPFDLLRQVDIVKEPGKTSYQGIISEDVSIELEGFPLTTRQTITWDLHVLE